MIDALHHDLENEHPVKGWLVPFVRAWPDHTKVEQAVLKHGRPSSGGAR